MEKVKQGLSYCPIDYEVSNTILRISYSKLVVKALEWFCISYHHYKYLLRDVCSKFSVSLIYY